MKSGREKGSAVLSWIWLMCFLFLGFGCGENTNWVAPLGGGAEETFTMTEYFPLTSSWETDRWTLFVDVREHEINGVATKAMVDTRQPRLLYWTNDKDGLRLHGLMEDDGFLQEFPTSLVFADAVVRVGDEKESTVTVDQEEIQFACKLVGVETVSVPAGVFEGCLRFVLSAYPVAEGPQDFGKETLWLAKGVGLVKAVADENAVICLFADTGQTRQLLSYHINSSPLTPDEEAIEELKRELAWNLEEENLDGVMALYSQDYYQGCWDWSDWRAWFEQSFADNADNRVFMSLGEIEVNGENAYAITEYLDTGVNEATSQRWWHWHRIGDLYKKEAGDWRFYGSQFGFSVDRFNVMVRNTTETGRNLAIRVKLMDCEDGRPIDSPDVVASLTITGPPETSIESDLKGDWYAPPTEPWRRGFRRTDDIENARPGFYSFRVEDQEGNFLDLTDYLEIQQPLDIPTLISPTDGEVVPAGDVLFSWNPVDGADAYRVRIAYWESDTWVSDTPTIEVSGTQVVVNLPAGTQFRWTVAAVQKDRYEEIDGRSRDVEAYFSTSEE